MHPLLVWLSLLLCCVIVATAPQRGEQEICGKPRCSWINSLLRKGEFTVGGQLSELDDGKAFCHMGVRVLSLDGLTRLWTDIRVAVTMTPKDKLIIGRSNSSEHALSGDKTATSVWNSTHYLHLSPYEVDCVGLVPEAGELVKYQLTVRKGLAYEGLLLLAVGLGLLFTAPRLSRSVTLFYSAGITVGVVASVLILLYVFSKFVPKRNLVGLGVLAGGYTLFASFFYWLWTHALEVAVNNWQYVTAYVVCAALVSFAVLYRMSPPSNERSLNLIQWTIQLVGVACVYLACPLQEVGVASVAVALILYKTCWLGWVLVPFRLIFWVVRCLLAPFSCVLIPLWRFLSFFNPWWWFRPSYRHRFLTLQEYEEQSRTETKKALEDLREYCRRHDNDEIWDKISNLHDSKRFTSFLAGKAHVSAQEQVDYEWTEAGLDSMSESGSDTTEYDDLPHRSPANSSRSFSMNSSSDSPTFMHTHSSLPHSSHSHFTSTPRTAYRHRPPSQH